MEKHFSLTDSPTFRMIELDAVDSTNNFLRQLDLQGDSRTTLVTAEYQQSGRGAGTNRWESEPGANLLFSLRVLPKCLPAKRMFALSEAAAMAVWRSLDLTFQRMKEGPDEGETKAKEVGEACGGEGFSVKWPNDVYFADSKVAGILIENDLQGLLVRSSVIGIGLNVNQRRFVSDAPNPRSLCQIVGHEVDRRAVLREFMTCFMHFMTVLDEGTDAALDTLHEHYKKHLFRWGEKHKFADGMGEFCATIVDVEPSGRLILMDEEGQRRRYEFKEVRHII